MVAWTVEEVAARLEEVMDIAEADGPQPIFDRGHEVAMILSASDYRRLVAEWEARMAAAEPAALPER